MKIIITDADILTVEQVNRVGPYLHRVVTKGTVRDTAWGWGIINISGGAHPSPELCIHRWGDFHEHQYIGPLDVVVEGVAG